VVYWGLLAVQVRFYIMNTQGGYDAYHNSNLVLLFSHLLAKSLRILVPRLANRSSTSLLEPRY